MVLSIYIYGPIYMVPLCDIWSYETCGGCLHLGLSRHRLKVSVANVFAKVLLMGC